VFFLFVHICLFLLSVSVFMTNKRVHSNDVILQRKQQCWHLLLLLLPCKVMFCSVARCWKKQGLTLVIWWTIVNFWNVELTSSWLVSTLYPVFLSTPASRLRLATKSRSESYLFRNNSAICGGNDSNNDSMFLFLCLARFILHQLFWQIMISDMFIILIFTLPGLKGW